MEPLEIVTCNPSSPRCASSNMSAYDSQGSHDVETAALATAVGGVELPQHKGRWRSGLCDCCADCDSCWAPCLCLPIPTAQLCVAIVLRGSRIPRTACVVLATLLWLCVVLQQLTYQGQHASAPSGAPSGRSGVVLGLALLSTGVVWAIRRAIRHRDRIPAACCEDLCCSVWCPCLAIGQMMRQERMSRGRYNLCSPTGQSEDLAV